MAESTSSTPSAPSEVWCSECELPTVREIDGRPYCSGHADMAERVLGARRDQVELTHVGPMTRVFAADVTTITGVAPAFREVRPLVEYAVNVIFPPALQNPSPEAERAAADAGSLAL